MSETPPDSESTETSETTRLSRDARAGRDALDTDTMQWVSAVVALIGLYIAGSPFIFEATEVALWNDLIVGGAIFLLAGYNNYRMMQNRLASVGAAALVVLLGLWAIATPYVIEMGSNELVTGTMVSGVIVVALSAYNTYANSKADTTERTTART